MCAARPLSSCLIKRRAWRAQTQSPVIDMISLSAAATAAVSLEHYCAVTCRLHATCAKLSFYDWRRPDLSSWIFLLLTAMLTSKVARRIDVIAHKFV